MADLSLCEVDGFSKSTSKTPPSHYIVKVQSFSLLAKSGIDKYYSNDFHAGGYTWKLVLHPNGNKSKDIEDHVSLYLVMEETSSLPPGWEVHAIFRLFLLNQNNDNFLIIQETAGKGRRFHGLKLEWGFDQFIPLTEFNNPSNGYLVNDTCVFGAEIYICEEKLKGVGECLSMIKDPITYSHNWRIPNFSRLSAECEESDTFHTGDHKWEIQLYPKGKGTGKGSHISLYIALADPTSLPPSSHIYAEFTLRILDQHNAKNYFGKAKSWFSKSNPVRGWPRFISSSLFNFSSMGFLVKDCCFIEAEVVVHAMTAVL